MPSIARTKNPIKKAPITLTKTVGQGENDCKSVPTIALPIEPIAPPQTDEEEELKAHYLNASEGRLIRRFLIFLRTQVIFLGIILLFDFRLL